LYRLAMSGQLVNKIKENTATINANIANLTALLNEAPEKLKQTLDTEKDVLKKENEVLKSDISKLIGELKNLETQAGIKQVEAKIPDAVAPQATPAAPAKVATKEPSVEKSPGPNENVQAKKEKPAKQPKAAAKPQGGEEDVRIDISRLDLRVGRIVSAKKHPDADSLYVEEVDLGEERPRTVVSGLVKFVPIEEMQNRMALLMCNLKPAKMRGVLSEAMVMCASTPEKVEILVVPEGSNPGDRVSCEGYPGEPDAQLNPKKKIWEQVAPDLKTDGNGIATFKGVPIVVPGKGNVKAPTLTNVQIK